MSDSSVHTLSLKCPCGYIKHDVIHLGVWQDKEQRILQYCGGLFIIDDSGEAVTCKKCPTSNVKSIEFHCSFCNRVTVIGVQERVAKRSGKVSVMQLSIHKTFVFSS